MSIIKELHKQRPAVRYALFALSSFIVLSAAGLAWFSGFERDAYFALTSDPAARDEFLARQDARLPQPLAALGRGFSGLAANIGSLIGLDSQKGFDTEVEHDTVHLLPLSK